MREIMGLVGLCSCRFRRSSTRGTPAYKAGYRRISAITIERNKRVVAQLHETVDAAEHEAKQQLPGIASQHSPAYRPGFKVYKLAKSRFPRTEFVPDPEKTDEENLEALDVYIREKETAFLMAFDQGEILQEVLLKNGFMFDVQTEALAETSPTTWSSARGTLRRRRLSASTTI